MRSARWPTVWSCSSSAVWNLILKRDSIATMRLMWLKESHSGTSAALRLGGEVADRVELLEFSRLELDFEARLDSDDEVDVVERVPLRYIGSAEIGRRGGRPCGAPRVQPSGT